MELFLNRIRFVFMLSHVLILVGVNLQWKLNDDNVVDWSLVAALQDTLYWLSEVSKVAGQNSPEFTKMDTLVTIDDI